jgi:hypothetical protein
MCSKWLAAAGLSVAVHSVSSHRQDGISYRSVCILCAAVLFYWQCCYSAA